MVGEIHLGDAMDAIGSGPANAIDRVGGAIAENLMGCQASVDEHGPVGRDAGKSQAGGRARRGVVEAKLSDHRVAVTAGPGPRLRHLRFLPTNPTRSSGSATYSVSATSRATSNAGPGAMGSRMPSTFTFAIPTAIGRRDLDKRLFTGDADHETFRWSTHDPRRRDFRGNEVIPTWFSEASAVFDLDGKPQLLTEIEQTAEEPVYAAKARQS
jgi:hypothetical protein